MESSIKKKQLNIGGMTCVSCQNKIENKLRNTAGINSTRVNYSSGLVDIVYDNDIITLKDITKIIEKLDYNVLSDDKHQVSDTKRIIGLIIIITSLYLFLQQLGVLNLLAPSQLADVSMGYAMLFVIGLLTSLHCVAMCGGISLSQCIPRNETGEGNASFSTLRPTFLYNLGRVLSYTAIGFVVGGLGSVVAFSNTVQGLLKLFAGVFMVIMGVNMLGIFPWIRKFAPRLPSVLFRGLDRKKFESKSPLFVGLLNGLMPCGPLQAMQLYALSTGSPFAGAISMLLFSLGTVPLMFGLGALSSALGKKFTSKVMTAGAVLVVVLGMSMFSQGWGLSGWSLPQFLPGSLSSKSSTSESNITVEDGVQIVNSTLSSGEYPSITVEAGLPVKWIIDAPQGSINGCNNRIFIPEYDIEYQFKTGENIIEFTPSKTGAFPFSCWMGMIRSTIQVVEPGTDISAANNSSRQEGFAGRKALNEPIPANYAIPTDEIGIAEQKDTYQQIKINLTDDGFQPAVIVVQANIDTEWVINNTSSREANFNLLVPYYAAQVPLNSSENSLNLYPVGDFDFSNGDGTLFGYVKVIDDIRQVDIDAIKKEVADFETMIWHSEAFQAGGSAASCH